MTPSFSRRDAIGRTESSASRLDQKRRNITGDEYFCDFGWVYEEKVAHSEVSGETTEEDVVSCYECARR